jgi:hypothetical protein
LHGQASVASTEEDACCNRSDFRLRPTCAFDALLPRSLPLVLSYPSEEKTSVRITTTGSCSTVHRDSLSPWDASLASLILSQPRTVPHPR